MRKILHPCDTKLYDNRFWPVFIKIEFSNGRLSLYGVVGPTISGNCRGSCGQIDMEFQRRDQPDSHYLIPANELRYAPEWDTSQWWDLLDIWKRWHLNDTRAGCEHQRALGWDSYDEHPSEPCPVCGYKYGTEWLKEDVPAEVVSWLMALPDSDRVPAWI